MSKMTIATDQQGNILGAIQHSEEKSYSDGLKVAVSFAPGTRLHVVDVDPDIDMTKISDVPKFHEALSRRAASAK